MTRFRWTCLLLTALAVVGVAASAVLAGSTAKKTTYWNNAIYGSSPAAGAWVGYNQTTTWTFDVYELKAALSGTVSLNFNGLSKGIHDGSGFSTGMKVVVAGAYTQSYSVTLDNPWRPHVAYNTVPGIGWQAYATLSLPDSIWKNRSSLTIKVTPLTTNTLISLDTNGLLIGYATPD